MMLNPNNDLVSALATLADAVEARAPADFLDAALRYAWQQVYKATGTAEYDEVPNTFFLWGKSLMDSEHADMPPKLSDEQLRAAFLATNTREPLAQGWPGLERFARAVEQLALTRLVPRPDYECHDGDKCSSPDWRQCESKCRRLSS